VGRASCVVDAPLKRGDRITAPVVIILIWITQISWPSSIQHVVDACVFVCTVLVTVHALWSASVRAILAAWRALRARLPQIVVLDRRRRLLVARWI
jgi:hypothetical protein